MRYIVVLCIALTLASCKPSPQKKAEDIGKLEAAILESAKKHISDTAKVKQLLNEYDYYQAEFSTDTLCPVYLLKAAEFYRYLALPDKALYCYHRVNTDFPNYPKASMSLFLEAFIYENDKHDLAKAGQLYKTYLDKYPNDKLAKSAKFSLDNLGKTPEQLMQQIDSSKTEKVN